METVFDIVSVIAVVGAVIAAIILVIVILNKFLKIFSIFWSNMQGYPSKEEKLAARALVELKRAEARADSAALKTRLAYENAVQNKSFYASYRASIAELSALYEEQVVLGKKKVWEHAEADAIRKAESAAQEVRTQAFAEEARQKQRDLALETIMSRAERAKENERHRHSSARSRVEPPVTRKPD